MRRLGLLLAVATLLWLAWLARRAGPSEPRDPDGAPPAAAADALDLDPRLAEFLGDCPRRDPYDADTSDPIALLVRKLEGGATEPLNRARAELAELGPRALPELGRFIAQAFDDPLRAAYVQNGLEVAALMQTHDGLPLLRRGLEHSVEAVRRAAIVGLARHATPSDYDALHALLPSERPDLRLELVDALHAADPARFVDEVLTWLAQSREPDLWSRAAPYLAHASDAETLARMRDTWRAQPLGVRVFLAAALARAAHEPLVGTAPAAEALAFLRETLLGADPAARALAAQALLAAERPEELLPLAADGDPALRKLAVDALDRHAQVPRGAAALGLALGDAEPGVRRAALAALVARGDAAAEDRALELLRGSVEELETALHALGRGFDARPDLAARAFALLAAEHDARAHRGPEALAALEQAIGRLPLPAAAAFLCDLARATDPLAPGSRSSLRDHRWLVLKAGNGGAAVRPELVARWSTEPDPQRRMDFVEALSFARDDDLRAFLAQAIERPDLDPHEVLQLAQVLARLGPTETVAPLLKRVTFTVDHPRVRPALHCLLWHWY